MNALLLKPLVTSTTCTLTFRIFAIAGLAFRPQAQAQMPAPPRVLTAIPRGTEPSSIMTIRTSEDEVDLLFTARDRGKHWVKNLSETDIRVVDAGHPPERFSTLLKKTNLRL